MFKYLLSARTTRTRRRDNVLSQIPAGLGAAPHGLGPLRGRCRNALRWRMHDLHPPGIAAEGVKRGLLLPSSSPQEDKFCLFRDAGEQTLDPRFHGDDR